MLDANTGNKIHSCPEDITVQDKTWGLGMWKTMLCWIACWTTVLANSHLKFFMKAFLSQRSMSFKRRSEGGQEGSFVKSLVQGTLPEK